MYTPINGYMKKSIIEVIERDFKGKAVKLDDESICEYLTLDGRKCAVGLFIPNGHDAQHSADGYYGLLQKYPDLNILMPLNKIGMNGLQHLHDNLNRDSSIAAQKDIILNWINEKVE